MSEPTIKQILHTADGITDKPMETERTYTQLEVDALLKAAAVNGAEAMRDIIKNEIMSAKLAAARYGHNEWLEGMVSAACYARDAKLPTELHDHLTEQKRLEYERGVSDGVESVARARTGNE